MDKISVIVVAGGVGKRMGANIPKQFLLLRDKPILMHTLNRFYEAYKHLDLRLILVLNPDYFDFWRTLKQEFNFQLPLIEVSGGKERFHSVKNGLALAYDQGVIAVHDAVRPFVTREFLLEAYKLAKVHGNAVPYTLPKSSVRIEIDNENKPLPRDKVRLIQTPQIFDAKKLKQAYKVRFNPEFTDDATVYQSLGEKIFLFEGLDFNIKITTEADFVLAKYFIEKKSF